MSGRDIAGKLALDNLRFTPQAKLSAAGRLAMAPRPEASEHAPARSRRCIRPLLPVIDALVASLAAMLVMSSMLEGVVYALLSPIAVALLVGYRTPPIGAWAIARGVLRLLVAPLLVGWGAAAIALGHDAGLAASQLLLLWTLTGIPWLAVRLLIVRAECRRPARVVILGGGTLAEWLVTSMTRRGRGRFEFLGFFDDRPGASATGSAKLPYLGGIAQLEDRLAAGEVDRLMVAFSSQPDYETLELLRACDHHGVHVDIVPRLFEYLGRAPRSYALGGVSIQTVPPRRERSVDHVLKRAIDVAGSALALLVTLPAIVAVAAAVKLQDGGPVLYRQRRIGQGGREFSILKFRSMRIDADTLDAASVAALRSGRASIESTVVAIKGQRDARVTRVGQFIRKTSLDELPQLWNVLRGDMSLVGPRPLRDFEVEALSDWEQIRQLKRPGITGLWQVSGRSEVSWAERMHLDYTYVRHWNLGDDLEILARTVPAVLAGDGAR